MSKKKSNIFTRSILLIILLRFALFKCCDSGLIRLCGATETGVTEVTEVRWR